MKKTIVAKLIFFVILFLYNNRIIARNIENTDTVIINNMINHALKIVHTNSDSAIRYFQNALYHIKKIDRPNSSKSILNRVDEQHGYILHQLGNIYLGKAKYPMALYYYQQSVNIRSSIGDLKGLSGTYNNLGIIYSYIGNIDSSFYYYKKSLALRQQLKDTIAITASFDNLALLYEDVGLVDSALFYFEQCLQIYQNKQMHSQIARTLNNIGNIYKNQGNIPVAIQHYQKGMKIAEQHKDSSSMASVYANLGQVYKMLNDYEKALYYYEKSLFVLSAIGDLRRKAQILHNIAIIYDEKLTEQIKIKNNIAIDTLFEKTLLLYNQSLEIKHNINDVHGIATTLLNIGNLKYKMLKVPNFDKEKSKIFKNEILINFQKALQYYTEIKYTYGIASALNTIAQYYFENNDFAKSLVNALNAYQIAVKSHYTEIIRNSAQLLHQIYFKQGNFKLAYQFYNEFVTLRDSIVKEENYRLSQQQFYQTLYEKQAYADSIAHADQLAIKNLEISRNQEKVKKQRVIIFFSVFVLLAIVAFLFILYRMFLQKKKANFLLSQQNLKIMNLNKALKTEKDISENLLLNILPSETALELKQNGVAVPRFYESVSVLFTDFKGFTKACTGLTPQEIVNELHMYFEIFDTIIEKYHLEKIKTIGDAYMCAGGLPIANNTHPYDVVNAGLEMQQFMLNLKEQRIKNNLPFWELRVGIHTGSVVSGVVGKKKFAYDIWGSTVNIASRMESNGEPGKVNISAATYQLIKNDFEFEYRGKIEAKNLGAIDMYFVKKKN